jgi:hypothetical protein
LPRPGGRDQTNVVQDFYVLSRENDTWMAAGYFMTNDSLGVGTLFRMNFQTNGAGDVMKNWFNWFKGAPADLTNVHRMVDGIVHLQVRPYDARGQVYRDNLDLPLHLRTNAAVMADIGLNPDWFYFKGDYLPAYLEVELGFIEPQTLRQLRAIDAATPGNPAPARAYMSQQLGKMHLFRQRVPIRNHNKPEAFVR